MTYTYAVGFTRSFKSLKKNSAFVSTCQKLAEESCVFIDPKHLDQNSLTSALTEVLSHKAKNKVFLVNQLSDLLPLGQPSLVIKALSQQGIAFLSLSEGLNCSGENV